MTCVQVLRALSVLPLLVMLCVTAHAQQGTSAVPDGIFAAPQKGGARRWVVDNPDGLALLVAPGTAETVGGVVAQHAVLTNFGCTEVLGALWCDVRPLHGGPRGYVPADALSPAKGPDGIVARGVNDSVTRARKKRFDIRAEVPCAQEQGEALAPCPIGIARSDGGDATAAVTFRNGFSRYLFFMHGAFISASATMSGAGRDTDWEVRGGTHYIRADDQQFQIPNALLFAQE